MNTGFVLEGHNFDMIPGDAFGLYATNNGNPLQNRRDNYGYVITEKTATHMVLASTAASSAHPANFLGGIVSSDRETIYWTNETNPLP